MVFTAEHIYQLIRATEIYLGQPNGVSDAELAVLMNVQRNAAHRYRKELTRIGVYPVSYGRYSLIPTEGMIYFAHVILNRQTIESGNPHKSLARRKRPAPHRTRPA